MRDEFCLASIPSLYFFPLVLYLENKYFCSFLCFLLVGVGLYTHVDSLLFFEVRLLVPPLANASAFPALLARLNMDVPFRWFLCSRFLPPDCALNCATRPKNKRNKNILLNLYNQLNLQNRLIQRKKINKMRISMLFTGQISTNRPLYALFSLNRFN